MYESDKRIVLTLDAGGTNFVFSAMQGCTQVVAPIHMPAEPDDLKKCLEVLVLGFRSVMGKIGESPSAISFAFPGPADYKNGVIGDLPNFRAFRGGVALKSYLENEFHIPVYINNDGNLFAYGEALAGVLPKVNKMLAVAGSSKIFNNLLGITLGTGFGGGVVINGELLTGDNGCGGDLWVFRNCFYGDKIAEESVSIRAVKRVYAERSGDNRTLTPKDIYEIAEGMAPGNMEAAMASFDALGTAAGDAVAHALTIVDGLVTVGGGLAGASKYIMPAFIRTLRSSLTTFAGKEFPRMQMQVFNLDDVQDLSSFLSIRPQKIKVPGTDMEINYDRDKYVGVMKSELTTNLAIAVGAYVYALNELDKTTNKN